MYLPDQVEFWYQLVTNFVLSLIITQIPQNQIKLSTSSSHTYIHMHTYSKNVQIIWQSLEYDRT